MPEPAEGRGVQWACEHAPAGPLDIAVQLPAQSLAHRVVCYFTNGSLLVPDHLVPTSAEEVGPRTNKDGPGLALLKHVNATPEQFLAWFTEQTWLARLCSRLYMLPHGGAVAQGGTGDMVAAQIAKAGMPTATLRVQVCPRKLEYDIALDSDTRVPGIQDALDSRGFRLDPRAGAFDAVLSVVRVGQDKWRYAYTPASCMWRVQPDAKRAYAELSSSAVNKLHEALLTCGHSEGALGAVIDLGAAPGAWSELLAQRAERVVAVDPAQLSENCAALPNVHHVRKASQDAVADVRQALGGGEADIIVCDMIQPPHFCADCIRPLLPLLRAGGHVVMTCKFIGHARDRSTFEADFRGFEAWEGLEGGTLVWLLANTNQERTWIARKSHTAPSDIVSDKQAQVLQSKPRKGSVAAALESGMSKQRRIERESSASKEM